MIGYDERQRLLRAYRREPASALGTVLKCLACLLILAGIALIGVSTESPRGPQRGAGDEARPVHRDERAAAEASRPRVEELPPARQTPATN